MACDCHELFYMYVRRCKGVTSGIKWICSDFCEFVLIEFTALFSLRLKHSYESVARENHP